MLKQGLGCRVGDGASINIMTDPWLPKEQNPFVQTNNIVLNDQKVKALMNMDGNGWDADLVRDIFNEEEADLILSISVNSENKDRWY